MSGFIESLVQKARKAPPVMVFPETGEERILLAASRARDMGIIKPVLVGTAADIDKKARELGFSFEGAKIIDNNEETVSRVIEKVLRAGGTLSEKALIKKARDPQNFAALLVACGEADALATGVNHTTGDVILCSQMLIGMQEGISTVSSIGILEVPGFCGSQGNLIAIADCAVCADPTAEERADIAIASADTVRRLLDWEPRVALITFSTKGSAQHPRIDDVLKTLEIVRAKRPDILIDGELQLDAAISPQIAAKKVPEGSAVAGKANVLIFPDLEAGNIGVKLVQQFAKAVAYGPLLQGFAKPVTDFSRSAPVEEMLGAIAMVAVQAQRAGEQA